MLNYNLIITVFARVHEQNILYFLFKCVISIAITGLLQLQNSHRSTYTHEEVFEDISVIGYKISDDANIFLLQHMTR